MKKFQIKVNGKSYEVEVEEIGGTMTPSAPVSTPTVSNPVPATQPAAPAPAAPQQNNTPAPAGGKSLTAPMPGKIMSIKVQVGQQVKADDVAVVLEAMKMENEIFCGVEGTVKEIRVSEGAAVNPGDVLVVIA